MSGAETTGAVTAPSPLSGLPSALTDGAYKYYVLAILTLVSFLNYMDRMALAVLVEPIKRELHLSDTQMGLLSGFAFAILYATLGLPLARLADTRSRTVILSACISIWSAMTAACGLAGGFLHMLLARIGVGVGEAGCVPSSHSLIGDYFSNARRAFAVSVLQAGGLAGLSLGLMFTGFLADRYGWRSAFFIVGAPGLLIGLVVALTVREPRRADQTNPSSPSDAPRLSYWAAGRHLASRPAFVHLVAGLSIGCFATYGLAQWLATFFIRVHGLSLTDTGLFTGLASGFGGVVGVLIGGAAGMRLIARDRRWELWLPGTTYALGCPLYLAVFLWPDPKVAIGLLFIATFVVGGGTGVALSAVQSLAERHLRATAVSIMMFFSALIGLGAGPFFVGLLSDLLRPHVGVQSVRVALIAVTPILLLSGLHFYWAARTMKKDMVA